VAFLFLNRFFPPSAFDFRCYVLFWVLLFVVGITIQIIIGTHSVTTQNYVRKQSRLLLNRPGRIRIANGPEEKTQLVDLSETGAMLFCAKPVKLGAAIELRFTLNIGPRIECVVYGDVRHYSVRETSHVVGVEFTHFMPETVEAIRRFVEKKAVVSEIEE